MSTSAVGRTDGVGTTPVTTTTPIEAMDHALLRAVDVVTEPDSTLDALAALLRELGQADYDDLAESWPTAFARMRALCWFASRQINERFSPAVRSAPPSGLAEVLRDVSRECLAPSCGVDRAPWESSVCEEQDCQREYFAAFGVAAS